jgi:hypothetical protein
MNSLNYSIYLHLTVASLVGGVKARADHQVAQKRKTKAEACPNSKQPGPINLPSKRRKAESLQAIDESILSKSKAWGNEC